MEIFGVPLQAMMSQLLLGLVNGSFYAMLSLGLAVIFGLLNVINFSHGALYMMGAFLAWMGMDYFQLNYWVMLILAPLVVGLFGMIVERTMLRRLYKLDHLYGLLFTFGVTLLLEGRVPFGVRRLRPAVFDARRTGRRHQSRFHDPAELPRLGRRGLAGGVLLDLVRDREDQAGRLPARRHREPEAGRKPSASTCR
jgi:branched-subunit amino acid ABC-type transport system permease component